MSTAIQVISGVASLMNDTAQTVYTNDAVLPYLNMALDELQEYYELNNVPVTNETSAILMVPKNTSRIASIGTTPLLPADLVEIQNLWESDKGMFQWMPVVRKEFISQNNSTQIDAFIVWSWMGNEIRLIPSTIDKDLKIDYVQSIFSTPILIGQISADLGVKNATSYLKYKTAALCAKYIGENSSRSDELNLLAIQGMDRALGISTKGRQAIVTRRRPFRAAYKTRGMA
jgi:hypothetical protein